MGVKRGATVLAFAAAAVVALPAAAGARSKTVYAGGPKINKAQIVKLLGKEARRVKADNPGLNAFLNQTVTINAGDSVKWVGLAANFHTVDIPALGGSDLPFVVPGPTVTGATDFAGNPFWFDGKLPGLGFNPALLAPIGGTTYNGTSRIDSGAPLAPHAPNTLKVTFTKAGVYKYFCDIHPGMIGYVVVKPKGKPIPSPKQDAAALNKQISALILAAGRLATHASQPANHVSLGLSTRQGLELYSMFPATLHVKAGTVVTFSMSLTSREVHTASFGPSAYLRNLASNLGMGPVPTSEVLYPSSNPALGPIPEGPTEHGNGFANTGGLDRDPTTPLPPSGKIDFTAPGTYHFVCLIHPFMRGTVIVTG